MTYDTGMFVYSDSISNLHIKNLFELLILRKSFEKFGGFLSILTRGQMR